METPFSDTEYPDFANFKINNFCLRCTDGELWFCKRILYRKTKLFRELFESEPEDDEIDVDFQCSIVHLVLQHMERQKDDQQIRITNEQLPQAYTLCVEWDYKEGIDYLSQYISNSPTVNGVAILYKFHDSRCEQATQNLLKSEPAAIYPDGKANLNPDLMLCVIKSMIAIHQNTVRDIVDRLTSKSRSKIITDTALKIRDQYMIRHERPQKETLKSQPRNGPL